LRIKYIKGFNNIRTDALSRKPDYENGRGPENFAIFAKDRKDLILNKQTVAATTKLEGDPFADKIKAAYTGNLIAEGIPEYL
jgi:hypothetical protein